jgi:hypothetical protein
MSEHLKDTRVANDYVFDNRLNPLYLEEDFKGTAILISLFRLNIYRTRKLVLQLHMEKLRRFILLEQEHLSKMGFQIT